MHIGVVNLSDRPYEPVLMHLPPYLQTEVKPNVLQKGEKGVITVTLDSERLTDFGLTQSSIWHVLQATRWAMKMRYLFPLFFCRTFRA